MTWLMFCGRCMGPGIAYRDTPMGRVYDADATPDPACVQCRGVGYAKASAAELRRHWAQVSRETPRPRRPAAAPS